IGDEHAITGVLTPGATQIIWTARSRCSRGEEELCNTSIVRRRTCTRRVGKDTIEIELPARPRRLQGRELHVLVLEPHFEGLLAINLGEIIRELHGGTDLI